MKTCTFKSVHKEKLHSAPCMLPTPLDFIDCCSFFLFLDYSLLLYWIYVSVFAYIYIYICPDLCGSSVKRKFTIKWRSLP